MLRDRGLLLQRGRSWELADGAEIPFPENIHRIISARVDNLTPDRKGLLQDASVIGKVFWSGALEAMGDRDGPGVSSLPPSERQRLKTIHARIGRARWVRCLRETDPLQRYVGARHE